MIPVNKAAVAVYARHHGESHEAACSAVYNYGFSEGQAAAVRAASITREVKEKQKHAEAKAA